jgi:hypothetical protein
VARKTHDEGAIEEGEEEDSYSYEEDILSIGKSNAKKALRPKWE